MNKSKLWTKNFLIVSTANFFLYFTFYLLMVTITLFATEKFHASPSEAGLASGIFVIGILIARIFSGRYIDQVGWKKMLYIGFILFLFTTCLYVLVNSMAFLLINRFLNGAAMGIASTATGTIVAKIIPQDRRGEGTGYYALSVTVAAAIGPFLGMFIVGHSTFYMNFVICIIFLVFSFIAVFFIKIPRLEFTKEQLEKRKGFSLKSFFEIKAIPISIIAALIALGYSSILTFLTSYTKEINLVNIGSFFFIVYAVFVLVSRPFTGRCFDKKGENFVMYPAILLFAIALVILSQSHKGFSLLLAGALVGLGYGTTSSSVQAISVKVSPKHRMGLATSTNFIFQDLGVGLGPFILGYFVPLIGYRGLYMIMAVVIFLCLFLYYFLHGRKIAYIEESDESVSA
ncbi:MFS transporter [Clostridium sp. CX1]|uniref:MFS transporter n=1 Tax=Clostridium tanneri TaxID=3037988 RepID=A0ABU4JTQ5_9CLOT|nr:MULTISPECIES: MFS transporter [unclassified Clostridium]MCT8975660.1 MFS transporter [Clostridium sp. CX1]MDW8801535.1 MFS transporter [Clostridium sp. A1-XYC3]